jgi:dolichol kinase
MRPYSNLDVLLQFISEIIIADLSLIGFMALTLFAGINLINFSSRGTPNFLVRKYFHILAFMTFLPGIIGAKYARPRLMVFAFNCVQVFLMLLEFARFKGFLPHNFSTWFKLLSDGREREPHTLIATHIYLLMGCALPLTMTYILHTGSIIPPDWTLWSLSGIIFLGIGDTAASIGGKHYGQTKWREISKKTQEGSNFCVLGCFLTFYPLCLIVAPQEGYRYLCFLFAAIPSAVVEGCTMQYDNLLCSMFFFTCVVFFNTLF